VRRTPLVGLLVLSVLGFSGCASASRRLNWSAPSADGTAAEETSARPRFSWWPGPKAESTAADPGAQVAQANPTARSAGSPTAPGDVWPDHRSDWMARHFPNLSRLWNGNATDSSRHDAPAADTIRISSRSRAPVASSRTRADSDVRTVDASRDETVDSRDDSSGVTNRDRFVPPLVPTPLLVPSRPDSPTDSTGAARSDDTIAEPERRNSADSEDSYPSLPQPRRALRSSVEPAPTPAAAAGAEERNEPPVDSSTETKSGVAAGATVDAMPARADAAAAGERNEPPVDASVKTETNTDPDVAVGSTVNREPELELVQAPAPPKPTTQPPSTVPPPPSLDPAPTPPAPPPAGAAKPPAEAATPAAPPPIEAKPAPAPAEETKPSPAEVPPVSEVAPATESQAPPAPAVPAPPPTATSPTPAPAPATAQSVPSGSGQAIYASPPPMAPPQPRRRFLSLFFIEEEKNEPLATPQFPAPTFPASYGGHYPRPYPVLAAPQADDVKPFFPTQTTKKPCVLKVWFHKMMSCGKGSGCSGCHHGGTAPCCSGCTCHSGKDKPAPAFPGANLASPQGGAVSPPGPSLHAAPIGSTGAKPGNIAEEGKLFERVSFDSFDKSPQS
jgi:hypothetical protein